jgi:hypothetical protein
MSNEEETMWRQFEHELETAIGSIKHSADAICRMQDLFEKQESALAAAKETCAVFDELINDLINVAGQDYTSQQIITELNKTWRQLEKDLEV